MHHIDLGSKLLRNIVSLRTYAETLPDGKKETVNQMYDRVMNMHIQKYPHLESDIRHIFSFVNDEKVMPSMRSMQFAGYSIQRSNCRIYNCAFLNIESFKDIADATWISMNGAGIGYSVQYRHISKLPIIDIGDNSSVHIVSDSKEGWADSIIAILSNPLQRFDYSQIRLKGVPLSTGGTASGPESLNVMHEKIRMILVNAIGRQLKSIEVHDIMCHIGDLVRCGGVRRTALLALFDVFDEEMLNCKSGDWWKENPHRGRANNSAIINRLDDDVDIKIAKVLNHCFDSNSGEPGIYLTNNLDWGCNPCAEIGMRSRTFCNLTEINASACKTEEDFYSATEFAVALGTIQASYTDFQYINEEWSINCKKDALLGVSITGQAEAQHILTQNVLQNASKIALDTNKAWSKKLNINEAARIGCVKPSGTTSAFLGTTSGIHAAHDEYYLRRIRIEKDNPLANWLIGIFGINDANSRSVIEKEWESDDLIVVTLPICKKDAIIRSNESAIQLLDRVKHIYLNWIKPTHRYGDNTHNVSVTVSYKDEDTSHIIAWMINNKNCYSGLTLLPYDGSIYQQMPFESITEDEYNKWIALFPKDLHLEQINFLGSEDTRSSESACSGGHCEII